MQITIHRGLNQIGGNIVEISTDSTKILLDSGLELEPVEIYEENEKNKENKGNEEIKEVESNEVHNKNINFNKLLAKNKFSAIFISHYHADHIGLLRNAQKLPPIYMGELAYNIFKATEEYKKQPVNFEPAGYLRHQVPIVIGDITVIPVFADHSACDSYSFIINADGKTIVYSGDFRSSGRKSFNSYLNALPQNVDAVICEGTNAGKDTVYLNEVQLEEKMIDVMKNANQVFVLMSALNIDRVVTVFKAARKSQRIMLQDVYMSLITDICGKNIPNPRTFKDVYAFTSKGLDDEQYKKYFEIYGTKKIGKERISNEKFVMCIRSSFKSYLQKLNKIKKLQDSVLIYSMWNGYKKQKNMKNFLHFAESLGMEIIDLHTSGHADCIALERFLERTNPKFIIPIHTVNNNWFFEKYGREKVITDEIFRV